MKYLHVMNYSNYTVQSIFVRFISEFFENNEHTFVFVGDFDEKFIQLDARCRIIHLKRREDIVPYLKEAGLILMHAMTFNAKMQMISLLHPNIMRKLVWIAWGGDLYKDKPEQNIKKTLLQVIKRCINITVKELFIRKLRFFVSIFDPDAKYFEENYKAKAKIVKSSYVGGCYEDIYKKTFEYVDIENKYNNGDCINILVGHQSNPELNHVRVLDNLVAYKDENIKLYIPLSYGNRANAVYVENYAKNLYGEKAIILKEWMSVDEYNRLLENIDIAIFDTVRQIALGNINKLAHMKKKIFIHPDSVIYNYYALNKVCIYDSTIIGKANFSVFISNVDRDSNIKFIREKVADREQKIEQWKNVFLLIEEK